MEKFFTVIVAIMALCAAAFVAVVVGLRMFIVPIIAVCLIVLAYCAITG